MKKHRCPNVCANDHPMSKSPLVVSQTEHIS
jgi:hypothetical protein